MTVLRAHRLRHETGIVEIALLQVDELPPIGQVYSVTRYTKLEAAGPSGLEVALSDYAEALTVPEDPCCGAQWEDCTDEVAGRFDRIDEIIDKA